MPTDRKLTAPDAAIPFAFEPVLSADDVDRLRAAFATRTMAASTRRALLGDGRLFVTWCGQTKHQAMPASRETVDAFLAAAAADGRSAATLRRYRSSLAWWHAAAGFANPCAGSAVAVPVPGPDLADAAMAALRTFMDVAQHGYAKATLRAAEADVRLFAGWCGQQGLSDLAPVRWTLVHADLSSACSGVMYPMAEWARWRL